MGLWKEERNKGKEGRKERSKEGKKGEREEQKEEGIINKIEYLAFEGKQ
jgi:hypothetical protein